MASPAGYERVACCLDGPRAGPALAEAVRIASLSGGRLSLVHVADSPGRYSGGRTAYSPPKDVLAAEIAAEARPWLEALAAESGGAEAVVLQGPDPAEALLAWAAEAGCDLLVIHPRRHGLVHRRLGSVTARLVRDAPCPVLVVHGPAGPEDPRARAAASGRRPRGAGRSAASTSIRRA
jgi:nucleotide-binding universal stress UspA family protein